MQIKTEIPVIRVANDSQDSGPWILLYQCEGYQHVYRRQTRRERTWVFRELNHDDKRARRYYIGDDFEDRVNTVEFLPQAFAEVTEHEGFYLVHYCDRNIDLTHGVEHWITVAALSQ